MSATEQISIRVEPTQQSRLSQVDFNHLKFGKIMSDHMLVANYDNGQWTDVAIVPYGELSVSPSMSALHYGQAIFEGIKGYKFADGTVSIFRPDTKLGAFNKSTQPFTNARSARRNLHGWLKEIIGRRPRLDSFQRRYRFIHSPIYVRYRSCIRRTSICFL